MKQVKVISENFDIVGEIYNVYTMEEVKQYMKDNDIDTTVFENEYKEQFTDFDNTEEVNIDVTKDMLKEDKYGNIKLRSKYIRKLDALDKII